MKISPLGRLLTLFAGLCSLAVPVAGQAAVPNAVSLEGALHAAGGGAAADGAYNVVFAIYKDSVGGTPVWSEGPVQVQVKGGLFSYMLGNKTPLTPAPLAGLTNAFIGVKIESDAELPRQLLTSTVYALRSALADGIECSGCIVAGHLDPAVLSGYAKTTALADYAKTSALAGYAKTADISKVGGSGAYADLAGLPDLSVFAIAANLSKVATSNKYSELTGLPDLTVYALTSGLANVAKTGKFVDLNGIPAGIQAGAACGTNLVVKGLKLDGSLDCVANGAGPVDPKFLPADGIDEVSNGLIANQFVDTTAGATKIAIKDYFPPGVTDVLTFPDIGTAQSLTVNLDISNSDVTGIVAYVTDPAKVKYHLCGVYKDGGGNDVGVPCGSGASFKTSYPKPTATVAGDLASWIGKNPKGDWTLNVVDTKFKDNGNDGQVNAWSVTIQTLSSKKVQVKANLLVDGSIKHGDDTTPCSSANAGTIRWNGSNFQGCNGKVWTGLQGADGSSPGSAALSCNDLHSQFPNLGDGTYWLDPNGGNNADAFQAPCNMTRQGGGWTMGLKTWYGAGIAGSTGAVGKVEDALLLKGNNWKLSDTQIKDIIGADNNFDMMQDQANYNTGYSSGNFEYAIIKNYTGVWRFDTAVAASSTTTAMYSYRISDNAQAWTGNLLCGKAGWGINCYDVIAGSNPAGGSGCSINMGAASSAGWHYIYTADTNQDTYIYLCNGAQHSSSYNMNHRVWFR